ncbi:hypothetical protein CROQUDRAFT_135934 [Cronartium quercuum f. sp. fusiforme G11]|uniref:Phosphatidylethanolamine-binding protein n=1 Tax=Cronartium quercuum f. sp. fusiforme G11 TaxID=708437 RepID=A0A9P6T8S7_9BASI|nr:hypothetical protein CROQUDRAFT_135934 [Cronartium quercuum f. sp. fusiforme G11]
MSHIIPFQNVVQSLVTSSLTTGPTPLLPSGFKPTVDLRLNYNGDQVAMGNLFPTTECTNPPNITFFSEDPAKPSLSYTLIMIDPDAPIPQSPIYANWCHWIIPGLMPTSYNEIITDLYNGPDPSSDESHSRSDEVSQTRMPIVQYYPPSPDEQSDPHRYIFLLYREPSSSIQETYLSLKSKDIGIDDTNIQTRKNFNFSNFAEKYQLTLVGINWFKSTNPDKMNETG